MVTRAELEAELESLRRELAELRAQAPDAGAAGARGGSGGDGGGGRDDRGNDGGNDGRGTDEADGGGGAAAASGAEATIAERLAAHGLEGADLDAFAAQLSDELRELMGKRPALTALTILALGFVLGRMSK